MNILDILSLAMQVWTDKFDVIPNAEVRNLLPAK
jgi:hypothetical protein